MIRGTRILSPVLEKTLRAGIHNRFDIEVVDSQTGRIKQRAVGHNTICNQLWSRLFSNQTYFSYIQYGSGAGTPSSGDTSLFTYVGGDAASTNSRSMDMKTGVYSVQRSIQLTASTAVGVTLSEVGIAYGTASNSLCTHAMLQDMNGNPISIEKTDTDVINIYATVFVHFNPNGYDDGNIHLVRRAQYDTKAVFMNFLTGIGGSGIIDSCGCFCGYSRMDGSASYGFEPSGSGVKKSVAVNRSLSNKTLTFTMSRIESNQIISGGFAEIILCTQGYSYPFLVARPGYGIPLSRIEKEAIGTGDGETTDFELDFPYAHDVRIYVDNVEVFDFETHYVPASNSEILFMDCLEDVSTPENHIPLCTLGQGHGYGNENLVFYNRAHIIGIGSVYMQDAGEIYCSDDLVSWEQVGSVSARGTLPVPEEYSHYKYWKMSSYSVHSYFRLSDSYTNKAIHLLNPPPSGSVITADYTSDWIAKDSNHVFDLVITIQLGEYTEAQ